MSELFNSEKPASPRGKPATARPRYLGRVIFVALLVMVLCIAAIVLPRALSFSKSTQDYTGTGTGEIEVVIPEGATGRGIAQVLADQGVVATTKAFVDACSDDERCRSIQPGTYQLKKQMSARAALSALLDPSNEVSIKVTIPEGFTIWQVNERLAKAFGVDVADVEAAESGDISLPSVAGGNPEGWIAPLTYVFKPGTSVEDALRTMVESRKNSLTAMGIAEDQWEQVLTKASIIEREGNTTDYTKVSRVIDNRLANQDQVMGKLQMDSTVLYGVHKTSGIPTADELANDNPYNTYLHAGLPPSPIGAAGEATIKAAISPEAGDWLYFVTVNLETGETKFSSSIDEHNANVAEFRAWLEAHPQASPSSSN